MKHILFSFILSMVAVTATSQEIKFFNGTLKEAFSEAAKQNKLVFMDSYADWCGPCKQMSETVFTDKEVADYYNEKFICVKLDIEKPTNKEFVMKNKISSIPDLRFFSADEKLQNKSLGAMEAAEFLKLGKIACGELPSFEQLYEKSRQEPQNLELKQTLLLDAPSFVGRVDTEEQEKWIARVDVVFSKYVKEKPIEECVNTNDFTIFAMYNAPIKKGNQIFEFLISNYQEYKKAFDSSAPAQYIIPTHCNMMLEMAKSGDVDYLKELERLHGDMKGIYVEISHPKLNIYDIQKNQLDAIYVIYNNKDLETYIELKESHFALLDDMVDANDYERAAVDLFTAMQGKLSKPAFIKCADWLIKAKSFNIKEPKKAQYLCMLADCYLGMDNKMKAKECYNEAFILAMQIGDQRMQVMIKSSLANMES